MTGWRTWAPDVGVGLVVLLVGLLEVLEVDPGYYGHDPRPALALLVLGIAAAAALSRHVPGAALALVWGVCTMQVLTDTRLLLVELAVGIVAFGCARWGSVATVVLSAVSIPAAAFIAVVALGPSELYSRLDTTGFRSLAAQATRWGDYWQVVAVAFGTAALGVPWLAGLALRFSARARQSRASQVVAEAQRDQAEEIARLRDQQARLATDVHDVVGHSLAVILAQAESAQYLPDADTGGLKRTMENIATSARTSLEDVRQVLASTSGSPPRARQVDLESLVEGVRASGHEVVSAEVGRPQPMPPELEVVAFRVLQEMLTNAIKHGRRDHPVRVERHWEGDLRIEVQNAVDAVEAVDAPEPAAPVSPEETQPVTVGRRPGGPGRPAGPAGPGGGHGLDGMRRRLEAVGGRLDVRRRTDPPTFTATAWVPLRDR